MALKFQKGDRVKILGHRLNAGRTAIVHHVPIDKHGYTLILDHNGFFTLSPEHEMEITLWKQENLMIG